MLTKTSLQAFKYTFRVSSILISDILSGLIWIQTMSPLARKKLNNIKTWMKVETVQKLNLKTYSMPTKHLQFQVQMVICLDNQKINQKSYTIKVTAHTWAIFFPKIDFFPFLIFCSTSYYHSSAFYVSGEKNVVIPVTLNVIPVTSQLCINY